jgi:hypothetical protein
VPDDYATLQAAVDALAPDGVILLKPGSFTDGATLWKPVSIQGAGPKQTHMTAANANRVLLSIPAGVGNVQLSGLMLLGGSTALVSYGRLDLREVKIAKTAYSGIELHGAGATFIQNAQIHNNNSRGITLDQSAELGLEDVELAFNSIGIHAEGANRVMAQHLLVRESRGYGMYLGGETIANFDQCKVSFNGEAGFWVSGAARVGLSNCIVSSNGAKGLWLTDHAAVDIRHGIIEKNGEDPDCLKDDEVPAHICNGIELWERARLTLFDTIIRNNMDWGISAWAIECGFPRKHPQYRYSGQVRFFSSHASESREVNRIEGNNRSGKERAKGNPGNHPWNQETIPDGQVCLP